jgi:hypothetical protein
VWDALKLFKKKDETTVLAKNEQDGRIKYSNSAAYIEPVWGYIFTENGILLEDSLEPNFYHPKATWRIAMPSYISCLKAIRNRGNVVRYPLAISLRHFWEWNYYHFYLDVLGKLALLKDNDLLSGIPIILGRYALELQFVSEIINTGYLKDLNWVIQDNFYVYADRAIYLKTHQSYRKRIDLIMDLMNVPDCSNPSNNRTFLTRLGNSARKITNGEEVSKYLAQRGFDVVDTQDMPLRQQIDIFSKTGILVGIHGAGMTNIIFRRHNALKVLELHPNCLRHKDHERIGQEFGYSWDTLAGTPVSNDIKKTDFYVPMDDLSMKVDLLLKPTALN